MDSRLLAGAYFKTFQAFEGENLEDTDRLEAIAKAKKLSLETNKRRKIQAHKRKLEAQREERRRQEILAKRREEQKHATEKYQRSHLPPSARQISERQNLRQKTVILDEALWMIRGNYLDRPKSAIVTSPRKEHDLIKERYFLENTRHRPMLSTRTTHNSERDNQNELMDSSLQNFTSSKTLFEQQLEQQQLLLLQQQEQSLKQFNQAIQKELKIAHEPSEPTNDSMVLTDNEVDSSSSVNSTDSIINGDKGKTNSSFKQSAYSQSYTRPEDNCNIKTVEQQPFFLHNITGNAVNDRSVSGSSMFRMSHDMTASAMYKVQVPKSMPQNDEALVAKPSDIITTFPIPPHPYAGPTAKDILKSQGNKQPLNLDKQSLINESSKIVSLKQYSTDSLESVNSISSNTQTDSNQNKAMNINTLLNFVDHNNTSSPQGQGNKNNNAWMSSSRSDVTSNERDNLLTNFQSRYTSAISSAICSRQSQTASSTRSCNDNPVTSLAAAVVIPVSSALNNHATTNTHLVEPVKPVITTNNVSIANTADNKTIIIAPDFNKPIKHYPLANFQNQTEKHQHQSPVCTIEYIDGNSQINTAKSQTTAFEVINPHPPSMPKSKPQPILAQISDTMKDAQENLDKKPPVAHIKYDLSLPPDLQENTSSPKKNVTLYHNNLTNNRMENIDLGSVTSADQELKEDDEECEDVKPVKGILKQSPVNSTFQDDQVLLGKPHPRDSLELARYQHDKKVKKKSVRFADHHIEETEYNISEQDLSETVTQRINRPMSAKFLFASTKGDPVVRETRATSSGSIWQNSNESTQMQIRNVQQIENRSNCQLDNIRLTESSVPVVNNRSNLPSSFTLPLNTTTPNRNRPRAAAHIIMSSDPYHMNKGQIDEVDNVISGEPIGSTSAATMAHKSNLDVKVKPVSNNFMSKVPVKVPTTNTNIMVYHTTFAGKDLEQGGNRLNHNSSHSAETTNQQVVAEAQHTDRSKIRDNINRRVAISNQIVTKTSIVPASSKINYSQTNSALPTYSDTSGGNVGTLAPVYDENGLRIDRTPTDEEITWLWDKVRSVLNREDGGNKTQGISSSLSDPGQKPSLALSTKLIDGTSLGFGTAKKGNGVRMVSGYFHPTGLAANQQVKPRPAVLQQGSYLKRFGLLKQRRTQSAHALGNNSAQPNPGVDNVVHSIPSVIQPLQPIMTNGPPEGPTPIALTYKPKEAVSESTAAFLMAERMTKQSLSDSHIQLAMEDAQIKQEVYNKSKLLATRGGPSALSIEEKRLMESLDRLNEKLQVLDSGKNNGTIHFHQPYQQQVALRTYTPVLDTKLNAMSSPRTQQRAQSARIRQQTRQYR